METDRLIDAAEKYAEAYEDDDRQDIKTDVMNAFFAGAKYAVKGDKVDCQCYKDGRCLHFDAPKKMFGYPKCILESDKLSAECKLRYPAFSSSGRPLPPPARTISGRLSPFHLKPS